MAIYDFGAVPTDAPTYLSTVAPHAALAATAWSVWIGLDAALVVIAVALYYIVRERNPIVAAIGTGLLGVYIVFDIAVTEVNSLRLAGLASSYAAATAAGQAQDVSIAAPLLSGLPWETFLSFFIGSLGLMLLSALLLRGPIRHGTAMFGIAANALGIVGGVGALVPALSITTTPSLLIVGLWYVLTGAQLYRWASGPSPAAATTPPVAAA